MPVCDVVVCARVNEMIQSHSMGEFDDSFCADDRERIRFMASARAIAKHGPIGRKVPTPPSSYSLLRIHTSGLGA